MWVFLCSCAVVSILQNMPSPTELADMLYAIFDDIWSSDSIAVVILAAEKYDDNHVFNGLPKI